MPPLPNTKMLFDEGNELTEEKVAVKNLPVRRIHIEACFRLRSDNEKRDDLVLLLKILYEAPSPRLEEGLFVLSQSVQKVENGKPDVCVCVVSSRQQNTVVNHLLENLAVERIAVNAALSRAGNFQQEEQDEEPTHNSIYW